MRRNKDLPKNLRDLVIRGSADDDEGDESEGDSDDESSDDQEDEEGEQGKDKAEDTTALKSALQKERRARKNNERELKKLQKLITDQGDKEKSEADKAKETASAAESKAQKLATQLRNSVIDNAIIKVAGKLKFRDIDDALKLVDRGEIDIEQDEDDPSTIELDEGSVETALQALARTKPHLIMADGQEDKSGSKFGGSRKSPEKMEEAKMQALYPALLQNRRLPQST